MTDSGFKVAMDAEDYPEIRDSIRKICAEFPASYWRGLEDQPLDRRYPEAFMRTLAEAGFLGPCIPEQYGGVELPMRAASVIIETLHETGCNAALVIAQMHLTELLLRHGSEEQKRAHLPRISEGQLRLHALGLLETESRTDLAAMTTVAGKSAGGYEISGTKRWVYGAASSNLMVLCARTSPAAAADDGDAQLSLFLIDLDEAQGASLDIQPVEGMNNDGSANIVLTQCKVAAHCLLGDAGSAVQYLQQASAVQCILTAAAAQGDSKFFIHKSTAYANERVVFGNPIGKYQGIQFPLAKAYIEAQGAEVIVREAVALYDAGHDAGAKASVARYLAVEAAWAMADAAFTTHGGFAFAREYDIERKWRDVRAMRNTPISTEEGLAHISTHILGLPA